MRPMTTAIRLFQGAVLVAALLFSGTSAWAQVLERIEVNRVGKDAEITIRFSTQIQYLRHAPPIQGRLLRVFLRLVNPPAPEQDLMQETLSSPKTDLVPPFSVMFPELVNGMLISFAKPTTWEVRAGPDNRSIVVIVPVEAGAKDLVAEARAAAEQPAAAAPAPVATDLAPAQPAPATKTPVPATTPIIAAPAAVVQPAPVPEPTVAAPAAAAEVPVVAPPTPAVVEPAPSTVDTAAAPPVLTAEQIEAMAARFDAEARQALAEKDLGKAINRLNRVLGLPTNGRTEAAQALIGEVREMNGEILKAKAEYDLYLRLYPKGAEAPRIRERLAKLPAVAPRQAARVPLQAGPAEWTYGGSLAQYLYKGKSHIEVTTPPPPGQLNFTTDTLSMTDQNALISTLDLNARRRDGISDTRIVFRDTDTKNFNNRQKDTNRLYSAYVEQSDKRVGYSVRAGRQSPTGGGVLERFDGIQAGYNVNTQWRVNGVAGIPVEFNSPYKKTFYGFSVDMQPQDGRPGLSAYYLQQQMDGAVSRQAVGLEGRYFTPQLTAYSMLDYDIAYRDLNIFMAQTNYRTDGGTNYFAYLDHRKTPPLGLTNAIAGLSGLSVREGLDSLGLSQMRDIAKAMTATSDMFAIGVTHPYSPRWMLGTDYRAARISGTKETATMPALPGSGLNHVLSVQAIGNGLWAVNDVGVVNANLIFGDTYRGQALGANYVFIYRDNWRLDGGLRYYGQRNDQSEKQVRLTPTFKVAYTWKFVTLEAEIGSENVRIDGPERVERSRRNYFFVGYRADMR
jgi:hypothetical protein